MVAVGPSSAQMIQPVFVSPWQICDKLGDTAGISLAINVDRTRGIGKYTTESGA